MSAKVGLFSALGALLGGAAGYYATKGERRRYYGGMGMASSEVVGATAGATIGAFIGGALASGPSSAGQIGVGQSDDAAPSTRTSTEVRSPTSTSTEVRSPTSTSTEVRSPTSTSTEAYTADNFTATVTGGAGAGATTTVNIYPIYFNRQPRSADGVAAFPSHEVPPPQAIKAMLHEVMSQAPATGVIRDMMHETMGPIPLLPAPPVGARRPS